MSCHLYLIRTGLKNRLKELLHKPGKLVLYLLLAVGLVAALAASQFGSVQNQGSGTAQPLSYLLLLFLAFLLLFYALAVQKGLTAGDAIFNMSDVNFLFVSPVNPRATLLYGVLRLVGVSFLAGFFILFQGSTLSLFGVGAGGLLLLFVTFTLHMIVLTLLSLVVYSATNGSPRRKWVARVLAVCVLLPLALVFVLHWVTTGDVLGALVTTADSPVLAATPFVGWASAGAIALLRGELAVGLGLLGLLLLSGGGLVLYLMRSRADYYEDVLVATENAFQKARAAAEGDMLGATSAAAGRSRVRGTGLAGKGASVFLYKHLRETFRQSHFGFFSLTTLIITGGALAAALIFLGSGDLPMLMQILMWMQVFMIGTGRGLLEMYAPYLYLIPASPFKKALWSNMELVVRTLVESILYLGLPGLLMGSPVVVTAGCMLAYLLFSLLLLGVNYLSLRWTQANVARGLLITLYMLAVLVLMIPGVVAAMVVGFSVGGIGGTALGLLVLSGWELVVALACFALSRNILHNCDMPSFKAG